MRSRIVACLLLVGGFSAAACQPEESTAPLGLLEQASEAKGGGGMAPLSTVAVPQPVGSDIIDRPAAVALGKAFYWDVQTGGDGKIACATCHFHAGADSRTTNVINPGPDGVFAATTGVSGAGQPFTPRSLTSDDRVGSQGMVGATFTGLDPDASTGADLCQPDLTAPFDGSRRVTGRNAPASFGAVFNRDNFWDGRANHSFNGADPFGHTGNGGGTLTMEGASLASQAVGPANNPTEMACAGRPFDGPGGLGTKLLARRPLQFQAVDPGDSVLGAYSAAPQLGLSATYQTLIDAAFLPSVASNSEAAFARIWGQAVAAYEATLVPDQTPLDRYLGGDGAALSENQKRGLDRFTGKGGCTKCHTGAELTDASVSLAAQSGLRNEDGGDQGFHNLGVRPTAEDLGRAGCPSPPCDGSGPGHFASSVSGSAMDRGAFKTPGLRNVGLTAPYFHNGGKATLEDVIDFYARGGDFANAEKSHRIRPLSFDAGDRAALVDFLRNGLTDCRVARERAPFDHPALELPNGEPLAAVGASGTGPCP
jgi:cytochrome c peroxidase